MTSSQQIHRGRSRAKIVLDAEEAAYGSVSHFAVGMLSAIGERLAERLGDLGAAEVVAQFSDQMTIRVPAHEVMAITGKSRAP